MSRRQFCQSVNGNNFDSDSANSICRCSFSLRNHEEGAQEKIIPLQVVHDDPLESREIEESKSIYCITWTFYFQTSLRPEVSWTRISLIVLDEDSYDGSTKTFDGLSSDFKQSTVRFRIKDENKRRTSKSSERFIYIVLPLNQLLKKTIISFTIYFLWKIIVESWKTSLWTSRSSVQCLGFKIVAAKTWKQRLSKIPTKIQISYLMYQWISFW